MHHFDTLEKGRFFNIHIPGLVLYVRVYIYLSVEGSLLLVG